MQSARRLEFEQDVLAASSRPLGWRADRAASWRAGTHRVFIVLLVLLGFGGIGGIAFALFGNGGRSAAGVADTSRKLVDALRTGTYANLPVLPPATPDDEAPIQALTSLRGQLADAGATFDSASPIAFGGVSAQVKASTGPNAQSANAVTGNVYFLAGEHVYALEVSLQREGDNYAVTRVWQCEPVNIDRDGAKAHAKAAYEAFRNEAATQTPTGEVSRTKYLFVRL